MVISLPFVPMILELINVADLSTIVVVLDVCGRLFDGLLVFVVVLSDDIGEVMIVTLLIDCDSFDWMVRVLQ